MQPGYPGTPLFGLCPPVRLLVGVVVVMDDPVTILADVTRVGDVVIDVTAAVAGGVGAAGLRGMVVTGFVGEGEAGFAKDMFAIWSANERRGVRHWVQRSAFGKLRYVHKWQVHLSTSCGGRPPSGGGLVGGPA